MTIIRPGTMVSAAFTSIFRPSGSRGARGARDWASRVFCRIQQCGYASTSARAALGNLIRSVPLDRVRNRKIGGFQIGFRLRTPSRSAVSSWINACPAVTLSPTFTSTDWTRPMAGKDRFACCTGTMTAEAVMPPAEASPGAGASNTMVGMASGVVAAPEQADRVNSRVKTIQMINSLHFFPVDCDLPSIRLSFSMTPSFKVTTWSYLMTRGSWVAKTKVVPVSWFNFFMMSMTCSPFSVSRLAVGCLQGSSLDRWTKPARQRRGRR